MNEILSKIFFPIQGWPLKMAAVYSSFAAVFLAFVLVGHSNGEATSKKAISTSASFAYGPGIDQRRTQLPVSYLYVQAVRAGAKGSK